MPVDDPVTAALRAVLEQVSAATGGKVADYIPSLAGADPDLLAIAGVSVLGNAYDAGDADAAFTIQSISKPFVYAVAVEDLGVAEVHRHVGFEPSGEPFNAISLDASGRPANPMINAGAIVTSALISGASPAERFDRIRSALSRFAGRPLELDQQVYESESSTGHRNRALAELTLSTGALVRSVEDATEVYFKQCSLLVTARDLALMAATVANHGINPVTGKRVVSAEATLHALSLMGSCGMYDRAGEWAFRVGMPAKSGVAGGILAVKPGQFGVGVFSPPLDEAGNSFRGTMALTMLSRQYGLHLLAHPNVPPSPVKGITRAPDGNVVVVLHGEIDLIAMERMVAQIKELLGPGVEPDTAVVLDLSDVGRIGPGAARVLADAEGGRAMWRRVELVDPAGLIPRTLAASREDTG